MVGAGAAPGGGDGAFDTGCGYDCRYGESDTGCGYVYVYGESDTACG